MDASTIRLEIDLDDPEIALALRLLRRQHHGVSDKQLLHSLVIYAARKAAEIFQEATEEVTA